MHDLRRRDFSLGVECPGSQILNPLRPQILLCRSVLPASRRSLINLHRLATTAPPVTNVFRNSVRKKTERAAQVSIVHLVEVDIIAGAGFVQIELS